MLTDILNLVWHALNFVLSMLLDLYVLHCNGIYFLMKDTGISADKHALIIPPFMGRGKRVHPVPFTDSSMSRKFTGSIQCSFSCFVY